MKCYPVIFLFTLIFSLWAIPGPLMAEGITQAFIEPPDTLEGLKTMILKAWSVFPNAFKAALNEAGAFWNNLVNWVRGWWSDNWADKVKAWLNRAWHELKSLFLDREAIFRQELDSEKKEMREDVKIKIPNLLEKFKEIVR